jgi:diguanylate cyclase (GGDEF)-like protein
MGRSLRSHYQPIYSIANGAVFGFEALARLSAPATFSSLEEMFRAAQSTGSLAALDLHCMLTALHCLDTVRFCPSQSYLFINSCPETLMNPDVSFAFIHDSLEALSLSPERIILEITEESVVSNYDLFRNSLNYLRRQGFKIAVDDFGSGYAGLKMLSTIEPDFLKIDRHFIANIDKAIIKYNLVDAIATACNRIGIHIVAEGIERTEELEIIQDLGIEYLQGFLVGRPSPELDYSPAVIPNRRAFIASSTDPLPDRCFIGNIVAFVEPLSPSAPTLTAMSRFLEARDLQSIPIVDNKKVVGILNRKRFFEEQVIEMGRSGSAYRADRKIADIMEHEFLHFDVNFTLQEVSKKISAKLGTSANENLVVLKHGNYHGMVEIPLLLDALTEQNIMLARDSNPLSGLPGNNTIQREITKRLAQNMHFDVLYLDVDHFKPFNDHYGFARGDMVIKELAGIIQHSLWKFESPFNFAGHIGGDDFILITRPAVSIGVAQCILDSFTLKLEQFHGKEDYRAATFRENNRQGALETFSLLSLSIGIVSTEVTNIHSYSHLASIACEVKKAAKLISGSSIVRDRRLLG